MKSKILQLGGREIPLTPRLSFLLLTLNRCICAWRNRRMIGLVLALVSDHLDTPGYRWFVSLIRRGIGTTEVLISLASTTLLVDLRDQGIGKSLFIYGTWEERPAQVYQQEIRKTAAQSDGSVVVDIGANIGYYTLLVSAVTEQDCQVLAIEPAEQNRQHLDRNVRLNDLSDRVDIRRAAIGESNGPGTLQLSRQSNLHRIEHERVGDRSGGAEQIDIWRFDDYLPASGYDLDDVIGVRMDLEGYELEALSGMRDYLNRPGPSVLYIEVHNNILSTEETRQISDLLSNAGYELVAVEYGDITAHPFEISIEADSWNSLPGIDGAYSLIATKPGE